MANFRCGLLTLSIFICRVFAVSSTAHEGHAVWNVKGGVTVRRDDDLSIVCSVTGLTTLDVVRVYHRTDGHARTIADNGDVKRPFSVLDRYSVQYTYDNGIGTTRIGYRGIQGRDAGTLGCYRLGAKEKEMAIVIVTVIVPVTEVYLAQIGPSGSTTQLPLVDQWMPIAGHQSTPMTLPAVTLHQGRSFGVSCVAVYDDVCAAASLPRLLRVMVGPVDVTSRFAMTTDSVRTTVVASSGTSTSTSATSRLRHGSPSVVDREGTPTGRRASSVASASLSSGATSGGVVWDVGGTSVTDLDACRSTVTLHYVTSEPDPLLNQQTLRCVANVHQTSLSSAASARLNVEFAPLMACDMYSATTSIGHSVMFGCEIRSNPTARVVVSRAGAGGGSTIAKSRHVYNLTDLDVIIREQAIAVDQVKVFLTVKPVDWSHFGRYTLTASNVVSVTSVSLELIEEPTYNGSYVPTTSKSSYASSTEQSTNPPADDGGEDVADNSSDEESNDDTEEDDEEDGGDELFVGSPNGTASEDTLTLDLQWSSMLSGATQRVTIKQPHVFLFCPLLALLPTRFLSTC